MAFEMDNFQVRSDLAWLRENRFLSVVDNQCRLTLLGLSALAKTNNIHASRIYGRCNAVLKSIQALIHPPHPPPRPDQRFDIASIARRLPGDRPKDVQELLIYFYNTDVLLPIPSAGGFWAPEAVTLGSDFITFIGKELDDLVRILWEERPRNARLLQAQVPIPPPTAAQDAGRPGDIREDPKLLTQVGARTAAGARDNSLSMIDDLLTRAKAFFLKRFAGTVLGDSKQELRDASTNAILLSFGRYLGLDFMAGVKLRGVAIEDLGKDENHVLLARFVDDTFRQADRDIGVTMGNTRTGMPAVSNAELPFSKRVIVYTNRVHALLAEISSVFMQRGVHIQVVSEEELFRTVFISYGGTDAAIAEQINDYLTAKGIKTWFFPKDAVPGQKLHREMHDAINSHDRVLLLCSKESLARPGVLNELERVLEREAKEGGSDILIPVALDDHVYTDWAPSKPDIASQVRSRVIAKVSGRIESNEANAELDKLVDALSVGK